MADITDLVQSAVSENADAVNYSAEGTDTEGLKFWVGAESNAPATRDSKTLYIFTS